MPDASPSCSRNVSTRAITFLQSFFPYVPKATSTRSLISPGVICGGDVILDISVLRASVSRFLPRIVPSFPIRNIFGVDRTP